MNDKSACCLCSQIKGEKRNDLISMMLNEDSYTRRVPIENNEFAVIPSLGPLAPGHSLLCPKVHTKSFASISLDRIDSFYEIKLRLLKVLKVAYNLPIHIFEHGGAKLSSRKICTVDHAHLHFVPLNRDIFKLINSDYMWIPVHRSLNNIKSVVGDDEYIYYESPEGSAYVTFSNDEPFESQYMRKILLEGSQRIKHWNWRQEPFPLKAHRIYEELSYVSSKIKAGRIEKFDHNQI